MNTYTIKEMSGIYHIPASTLRYYEEIGILTNVKRTKNHQRIYTDEHRCRLESIHCFKNTGLSLSKMQEFYIYESDMEHNIDAILSLMQKHEKNTEKQILKMQKELVHIKKKVLFYQKIKQAIDKNTAWPKWEP
ncbi:MAG: MerR family transcriptional regulator [Eubacterium sp.]|nr:MerR family transcriptional regulator [Eubacterium sp.]